MATGARSTKRPRCDGDDATWRDGVKWVSSEGGFISSSLAFDPAERRVTTLAPVPEGTVLMKIPAPCLLTVGKVAETDAGRALIEAAEAACSCRPPHNDRDDLVLALYMASLSADPPPDRHFGPYLATLPDPESYDTIPRRWSDGRLRSLLGGTSLLRRAERDREGLRGDYEAIRSKWEGSDGGDGSGSSAPPHFPPFAPFDDMFAAVCSRGFSGMGGGAAGAAGDAMVPLLDLCDHRRGSAGCGKGVGYARTEDGGVEVAAHRDLPAGSSLHITYGARGNAQLLSRYGFCIEDNVERDGSSNDVVEFDSGVGRPVVELRAGPKSYTYGGFVKALELFVDEDGKCGGAISSSDIGGAGAAGSDGILGAENDDGGGGSVEDEMESFLDQCDEEEGDGLASMFYGGCDSGIDGEEEEKEDEEEAIAAECRALGRLSIELERKRCRYALDPEGDGAAPPGNNAPCRRYASILVRSEQRTLELFRRAADGIRSRLSGGTDAGGEAGGGGAPPPIDAAAAAAADPLLARQANELVRAYSTIRHGGMAF